MRRGMTLIELLVVIAVIAVLVGLTYTALLQARKRGYLTVCIGNLRQLTLAVHAYENDWGMVPIEYIHKTPEGTYGFVQQIIYPYVRDDNIWHVNGNITIVARYDGRIEIVPKGRYKRISVITED